MATAQGLRQASFRAIAGTAGTYNEDMMAACQAEAVVPAGATLNEALILWLKARLGSSDSNLPGLMQAFAEANGADNWSSLGSFGAQIQLGTIEQTGWNNTDQTAQYFHGAPTVDGDGAGMVIGFMWVNDFATRNNDVSDGSITLNSVAPDAVISTHMRNTGVDRYGQIYMAYWAAPTSGFAVLTLPSACDGDSGGYFTINVKGLKASPVGTLVRDQGPADPLAFQITPSTPGSLVVSVLVSQNGDVGPIVWDSSLGTGLSDYGGAGSGNGTTGQRYWLRPASGAALDAGGNATENLDGMAVELLAA